ncbi:MAG: PhzF family phenazine biosynthesis protein [Actinomycetota bacterium]|nr:PhzF family phenazine biosynthesis protein [Actinomycetota bacterium]
MHLSFRLVDVFAERPLEGNQLCVVPDAADLDTETMHVVAREIGFSETAFVTGIDGDRYDLRIFTPGKEMPFAGHPTVGTAFLLVLEGRIGSPAVQRVAAGEFHVEADMAAGTARVRQLAPTFGAEMRDPERLSGALGLSPEDIHPELPAQVVSTGLAHFLVPAATPDAVTDARPNQRVLSEVVREAGTDGLYLFAVTEEGAKARFFGEGIGIDEDPATGSAAGPLGAYMAARGLGGLPGHLIVRQGVEVGRPSALHVEVTAEGDSWEVWVGGGVFVVGRGEFELPGA